MRAACRGHRGTQYTQSMRAPTEGASPQQIGRRLAYVLRHNPAHWGLVLDAAGWVSLDAMVAGAQRAGTAITAAVVWTAVAADTKARFTISADGTRIRAAQGHSVVVALGLPTSTPPDRLYHGTTAQAWAAIQRVGLTPQSRQQVHLSATIAIARDVGARRGPPIVLSVAAAALVTAGYHFVLAANGVWLTDAVPAWALFVAPP
jgi:putative RNA 2'-phosphotransferase